MKPADRAWVQMAAFIAVWDATCPSGQTLSEGFRGYARHRPLLTTTVVGYLLAHLYGILPQRYDVLHRLAGLLPKDNAS